MSSFLSPYNLYLITEQYPYGAGEVFVHNELKVISRFFDNIYILPLNRKDKQVYEPPSNVHILDCLYSTSPKQHQLRKTLFANIFLVFKIVLLELIKNKGKRKYVWSKKKNIIIEICSAIDHSDNIHRLINTKTPEGSTILYSFWMNNGALIFSILKYKTNIGKYIFRVHGYDLYDERKPGRYMPYRYFNMQQCDNVYTVCRYAQNYLKAKNMFPGKVLLDHLGTFDHGEGAFDPDSRFTVVSCSNIWPIKRIHLIIEILGQLDFELSWFHFGEGPLMQELIGQASSLPPNV
jgi:hypothetical protein